MENSIINDWGIDPGFLILGLPIEVIFPCIGSERYIHP